MKSSHKKNQINKLLLQLIWIQTQTHSSNKNQEKQQKTTKECSVCKETKKELLLCSRCR